PGRRDIADVGTGSGAIAVSIAASIPDARITATDISASALAVADSNAHKHEVAERLQFMQCDLLPAGPGFDLICANLPYIPSETLRGLGVYDREPVLALDGGADGLDLIRRLLDLAADRLMPGGLMLLEIEASQGMKAISLAFDRYAEAQIHLHRDLAGRDRLLEIAL
ncbi:MAG TPA: HemK family protein methyltransferase, partial [Anaerolineales bacterium]